MGSEGVGGTVEERGHAAVDVLRPEPLITCPIVAKSLQLFLFPWCILTFSDFYEMRPKADRFRSEFSLPSLERLRCLSQGTLKRLLRNCTDVHQEDSVNAL